MADINNWYSGLETSLGQNLSDLRTIGPEMILAGTFIVAMVWDFLQKKTADKASIALICIVGIVASLFVAVLGPGGMGAGQSAYQGLIQIDQFGTFFKIFIGAATIIALTMAMDSWEIQRLDSAQGEYYYLMLATCFGGYLLSSATNLLLIYLGLEALSLTSYALAGYLPGSRKSAEAGMKYVIYGAMASGIMIFGMSYLFGLTGSLDLTAIAASLKHTVHDWNMLHQTGYMTTAEHTNRVAALSIMFLMVFAGFAYKISAAPFHFWTPDVYEGAPTVSTSFFSTAPKAAGFAVLVRVMMEMFITKSTRIFDDPSTIQAIAGVAAVATMFIGNLTALAQTNAKRMLAYSSIAHAGYMLAVLTVPLPGVGMSGGMGPLLFYLIAYLFMNFGAFIVVMALEQKRGSSEIAAFGGAVKTDTWLTVTMCVFLFSLVGMPPLSGFMGKFMIFKQLADVQAGGGTGWHWLMIAVMGVNSVISLFYYIRIARTMIVDPVPAGAAGSAEAQAPTPISLHLLTFAFSIVTIGLGLFFQPAMERMIDIGRHIMN